jgi:hypothetical protein
MKDARLSKDRHRADIRSPDDIDRSLDLHGYSLNGVACGHCEVQTSRNTHCWLHYCVAVRGGCKKDVLGVTELNQGWLSYDGHSSSRCAYVLLEECIAN